MLHCQSIDISTSMWYFVHCQFLYMYFVNIVVHVSLQQILILQFIIRSQDTVVCVSVVFFSLNEMLTTLIRKQEANFLPRFYSLFPI